MLFQGRWKKLLMSISLGAPVVVGCTSPSYTTGDLIKQDKLSLEKAVEVAKAEAAIKATVERFIGVFSRYSQKEIARVIPEMYEDKAFLNDRIHSVRGNENIATYFNGTFDKVDKAKFDIHEVYYGKSDAVLRWTMVLYISEGDEPMMFQGMSQLRFNGDGKIIFHQDYWDFSEFVSDIWGIGGIINFIKSKA